jgi:hypothetical protein
MADEIHVPPDVWRLDAAPDAVDDAATAWWTYAQVPPGIADSVTEGVGVAESWGGTAPTTTTSRCICPG